jgi:L-lactate dehydrogenase complex protein LldG
VVERALTDSASTILSALRTALAGSDPHPPEVPRGYRSTPRGWLPERFSARVAEYRATVHRCDAEVITPTIARIVATRGSPAVVCATGVSALLQPPLEVIVDDGALSAHELDGIGTVVTGCAVAIAETGTFVLDGGPASGRRLLSLVPDHHVCIVREDQIVDDVPEAFDLLDPGLPLTFVSGPSATSDIELDRVEGVHGPRVLDVVVVG